MNVNRDAELIALKKELRSIVVSSQFEIDINGLRRDFRSINGTNIPTSSFNYRDLNTFLREQCGDIFQFKGTGNNPVLIPIITKEISHLENLISHQKNTKYKGRRRTSIYESSPSIKDKENHANVSIKYSCENKAPRNSFKNEINRKSSEANFSFKDDLEPLHKSSVINWPRNHGQFLPGIINNNTNSFKQNDSNMSTSRKEIKLIEDEKYSKEGEQAEFNSENIKYTPSTHDNEAMHDPAIITYSKPNSLVFSNLRISENTSDDMHKNGYQNSNLRPFSSSSESTYRSSEINDFAQAGSSQSCSLQSSYESKDNGSSHSFRKKKREKDLTVNFTKLAAKHPDGIWASEFNIKYKELFGCELNFNGMGFISITQMCRAFPTCWRILRPIRHGDALLLHPQFDPEKSLLFQENSTRSSPEPEPFIPQKRDTKTPDALPGIEFSAYPPDSLTIHDHIESLELPPAFTTPDAMIEIHVAEISDPTHFWYQLHGPRNSVAMNSIMDDMNVFYNGPEGQEYRFVYDAANVGLYCAALYQNDWHRAVIVQDCGPDAIKVRHIDYGTVVKVEMKDIRFLKNEFASLKAQALRGRLAKIKPKAPGDNPTYWPLKASQMFLKLVFEKNLIATVYFYNEEKQFLSMFLTDTTIANEDIYINEELINKEVAVACKESDDIASNDHWTCKIHCYDDVESGIALSFSEMIYINDYELPIEDILSALNPDERTKAETEAAFLNKMRQSILLSRFEELRALEEAIEDEDEPSMDESVSRPDDEAASDSRENVASSLNYDNFSERVGHSNDAFNQFNDNRRILSPVGNFVGASNQFNPAVVSPFGAPQGFPDFYPAPVDGPPGFQSFTPSPMNVPNYPPSVPYHSYPPQCYYRRVVYSPPDCPFPVGATPYRFPPPILMQPQIHVLPHQIHNVGQFHPPPGRPVQIRAPAEAPPPAQAFWNPLAQSAKTANGTKSTQIDPKWKNQHTKGFWDVNTPPFQPQFSPANNDVHKRNELRTVNPSTEISLPPRQNSLPAPTKIN